MIQKNNCDIIEFWSKKKVWLECWICCSIIHENIELNFPYKSYKKFSSGNPRQPRKIIFDRLRNLSQESSVCLLHTWKNRKYQENFDVFWTQRCICWVVVLPSKIRISRVEGSTGTLYMLKKAAKDDPLNTKEDYPASEASLPQEFPNNCTYRLLKNWTIRQIFGTIRVFAFSSSIVC